MIDLSTVGTNFLNEIVTLMGFIFVDIPLAFIGTTLGSGKVFDLITTFLDNQNIQQLVFLLIIVGGPLLMAIQMKKTGGKQVGNIR